MTKLPCDDDATDHHFDVAGRNSEGGPSHAVRVRGTQFGELLKKPISSYEAKKPKCLRRTSPRFDITDPYDVSMVTSGFKRDFSVEFDDAGDLRFEGLEFMPASPSPNGKPLLIVANEVSGTTTIYEISK